MTVAAPLHHQVLLNPRPLDPAKRAAVLADPGFGVRFTDHMFTLRWTAPDGWHDARVEPYGPLPLMPGATVLQYAQQVYEGLKAYRHPDGSVWAFRPEMDAARLRRSAERLALPELPTELFLDSLRALLAVDQAWVPDPDGGRSLYLRPFLMGTEQFLGTRPSQEVVYVLIASPSGSYFRGGITPVDLWLSEEYARAGLGGTGDTKCAANYAAGLRPLQQALDHGCSQTLFLDSESHTYLDELAGMNLMLVTADGRLLTPSLTGSILPGVTRDSLLQLAPDIGLTVEERRVSLQEWRTGVVDGTISEVFACGTAAVVAPVGSVRAAGFSIPPAPNTGGPVTTRLRQALTDLHFGRTPDTRGWLVPLA